MLKERIDRERLDVRIELDGGVTEENLDEVAASPAIWRTSWSVSALPLAPDAASRPLRPRVPK